MSQSPSSLMAALSIQPQKVVEDDELDAFRKEWQAELATRRPGGEQSSTAATTSNAIADGSSKPLSPKAKPIKITPNGSLSPKSPPKPPLSPTKLSPKNAARSPTSSTRKTSTAAFSTSPDSTIPFPQRQKEHRSAVTLYARAVEAEQSGQLNDALHLYRQAFRADDNVDKLYARTVRQQTQPSSQPGAAPEPTVVEGPTPADIVDPSAPEIAPYSFTRHVQVQPDYDRTRGSRGSVSRLTGIIMSRVGIVPEDHEGDYDPAAEFKPQEDAPMPLALLPPELLEHVLQRLDVGSLEAFGSTCWRARSLTAHSGVWKRLVERIYQPPVIDQEAEIGELVKRHHGEWRTMLVEHERVRMDGCYISVCHYIRPGAGEHWVAITHMVTYHRFLRFYPDGSVISFLTTDHPSEVVPVLKRDLRAKGLNTGVWRLVNDVDERGKKRSRVLITELSEPGVGGRYEFEMELGLRETNRGRWNKLDLNQYSSVEVATGDVQGLSLKHQKPFYFSKVRSYNQHL